MPRCKLNFTEEITDVTEPLKTKAMCNTAYRDHSTYMMDLKNRLLNIRLGSTNVIPQDSGYTIISNRFGT